jgi:hypothetical protein
MRLSLGMIGGGEGAFIGGVHRMAARLDDRWTLVAGAFSSDAGRSRAFGRALGLDDDRCYSDWRRPRPRGPTGSTRWPSSRRTTCITGQRGPSSTPASR